MTTEPEDPKKRGRIATAFEEWSRPIGFISLTALSFAQVVMGVTVHEMAWYSAALLVAGAHFLELAERVADKIIKALNIVKK